MSLRGALLRHGATLQSASVVAACLVIWVLRRPQQLSRPYVWVEESHLIRNFLEDGWAGALEPIEGYLILPANVLVALATEISFVRLPNLMYAFGTVVSSRPFCCFSSPTRAGAA
jgi:hypothetical protein